MPKSLRNRLRRLEQESRDNYSEIIAVIKQGAFYDELSDNQKALYSEYYGLRRQELEDVTFKFAECFGEDINQALHFKLELKPTPPTPEEFSKILDEIERQVLGGDIE